MRNRKGKTTNTRNGTTNHEKNNQEEPRTSFVPDEDSRDHHDQHDQRNLNDSREEGELGPDDSNDVMN